MAHTSKARPLLIEVYMRVNGLLALVVGRVTGHQGEFYPARVNVFIVQSSQVSWDVEIE